MYYRVRRQGVELGTFTLEQLRERRASGEFTGNEYVMCDGRFSWQPLDFLLTHGPEAMPPPVAGPAKPPSQKLVWSIVILAVAVMVGGIAYVAVRAFNVARSLQTNRNIVVNSRSGSSQGQVQEVTSPAALEAAKKPISWTSNTWTSVQVNNRDREFRLRQWLGNYKDHGRHDQPWDADATLLIKSWLAEGYGSEETNLPAAHDLSEKLGRRSDIDDPLVLTVMAMSSVELHEKDRLLRRALQLFPDSKYRAYPKFYATVMAENNSVNGQRRNEMDSQAMRYFGIALTDGSFTSADQPELGDILLNGWARSLIKRMANAPGVVVNGSGKDYKWLALVLEGEYEIDTAWKARGSGYANKVTQQGWNDFSRHLANARQKLSDAWQMHQDYPLAADRMEYVALGDSDITEMRLWFDRATAAQIDYSAAWHELRWGLRPRWYGSHEAILDLGMTAVNTGRFDTDVPRMFYDCISDVESELELKPGEHIYAREDVWPTLQRMYEGYIALPGGNTNGWRTTYTIMAYYAGKYNVARAQLEALKWDPVRYNFYNWDRDLSLLPEEVAARTGSQSDIITRGENRRHNGRLGAALTSFHNAEKSTNTDTRTREFVRCRLASLDSELRLQKGEWIDFLPKDEHDPNWVFVRGKTRFLPDGGIEVDSGPDGHMLYSRVRVGALFEVKGEFEVVNSSTKDYQAGLVMGLPDLEGSRWNSFRVKDNATEGRVLSLGHGWFTQQVARQADLQGQKHSFTFRFVNYNATASVDGNEVLREAKQPRGLGLDPHEYLVGLGAYNDMNTTTIRYRNLQVRRITTKTATPRPATTDESDSQ